MSEELKALKRVVNEISNYKLHGVGDENWLGIQDVLKDISTIEKALKRNEPMKVDVKTERDWFHKCPNCKGYNVEIRLSYCPDCGQSLDWSNEK